MEIPPYFAICNDLSNTENDYAAYENRYKIVNVVRDPSANHYTLIAEEPHTTLVNIRNEPLYNHDPSKILLKLPQGDLDLYIWHTPHSIFHNESWIPVVDTTASYKIPGSCIYTVNGDTVSQYTVRVMRLHSIRLRMMDRLTRMVEPLINRSVVPKFVADLIYKNAIEKADHCPISLTLFKDCTSVTLTPCYHLFETAHLTNWLSTNIACPVCNQHAR